MMDKIIEILAYKWYVDCRVYNIPVSPSDVKDIVEDLLKTKTEQEELEEVKMKKYNIDHYEEFSNKVLVMPPLDEFDDGSIDETEWYKAHQIHITVGNHDMVLDYNADNVTELDGALKAMYEMEMDFKSVGESDESRFKENLTDAFKTHMFMQDRDKHTLNELLYVLSHNTAFEDMDFNITIIKLDSGCYCIPCLDAFVPTEARAMWFEDAKVEFEVEDFGEEKYNCITIYESEGV